MSEPVDRLADLYGGDHQSLFSVLDQSMDPRGPKLPDDHVDFVWCRDVLEHVEDVEAGLTEAARVLEPSGHMLLYTFFATDRDDPVQAERRGRMVVHATSMDRAHVEGAITRAGLTIEVRDEIGTEWREFEEERHQPVSRDLLRLARLRRRRDELIEQFGQREYEIAEASLEWLANIMLGKVEPVMYLLRPVR